MTDTTGKMIEEHPVAWGEFYGDKCVTVTLMPGKFNTEPLYRAILSTTQTGKEGDAFGPVRTNLRSQPAMGLSEEEHRVVEDLRKLVALGVEGLRGDFGKVIAIIDRLTGRSEGR